MLHSKYVFQISKFENGWRHFLGFSPSVLSPGHCIQCESILPIWLCWNLNLFDVFFLVPEKMHFRKTKDKSNFIETSQCSGKMRSVWVSNTFSQTIFKMAPNCIWCPHFCNPCGLSQFPNILLTIHFVFQFQTYYTAFGNSFPVLIWEPDLPSKATFCFTSY